jgi:hypothetical protein
MHLTPRTAQEIAGRVRPASVGELAFVPFVVGAEGALDDRAAAAGHRHVDLFVSRVAMPEGKAHTGFDALAFLIVSR